ITSSQVRSWPITVTDSPATSLPSTVDDEEGRSRRFSASAVTIRTSSDVGVAAASTSSTVSVTAAGAVGKATRLTGTMKLGPASLVTAATSVDSRLSAATGADTGAGIQFAFGATRIVSAPSDTTNIRKLRSMAGLPDPYVV